MKKLVSLILAVVLCLSLFCGCHTTTDNYGDAVIGNDRFIFIDCIDEDEQIYVAYDKITNIVYYYDDMGPNSGVSSNYFVCKDGAMYGAIYEDGKIKPIPFATITP